MTRKGHDRNSRHAVRVAALAFCGMATLATPSFAGRLYVDRTASSAGDGSSWANAYKSLSDALYNAWHDLDVDAIWVARGTYTDGSFHVPADVRLLGGFAGDERRARNRLPELNETRLAGRVEVSTNGVEIDGFTMEGGTSYALELQGEETRIADCRFVGNTVDSSIYLSRGADALIEGCTFQDNSGYSIKISSSRASEPYSATISDCVFDSNMECAVLIVGDSDDPGGEVSVVGSTFIGNNGTKTGAIRHTGTDAGELFVSNSLFCDNYGEDAGAILTSGPWAAISNCTIVRNVGRWGPGGVSMQGSGYNDVFNSILWDNTSQMNLGHHRQSDEIDWSDPSTAHVERSIVMDWSGDGISSYAVSTADPQFLRRRNAFWSLGLDSPAIDAGDNTLVLGDLSYDAYGRSRYVDRTDVEDTGYSPDGRGVIDLGALERQ